MTKWNRVYRSDNKQVYVYERCGEYKAIAYGFYRLFKGEDALKNVIQYVSDFGDTKVDIKETVNA
jgi:hypothetical protein